MTSCKLCSSIEPKKKKTPISKNEAIGHAKFHWKQMKFVDDEEINLEKVFESCFGEKIPTKNNRNVPKNPSLLHQTLKAYCQKLFGDRPAAPRMTCNLCSVGIKVIHTQGNWLQTHPIIDHACAHVGAKLFECRHCDRRFALKFVVLRHVKDCHNVERPTITDDFHDHSSEIEKQILDMIKKCFFGCKSTTISKEDHKSMIAANMLRGHTSGKSQLATGRHLLCNRLVRKIIDAEGSIECAVCSKRLSIRKADGEMFCQSALLHVQCHLVKPLYRCKICDETCASYKSITKHLKNKHAMSMAKNYEDSCDQFHAEIEAMLLKCFEGKSASTQSQQRPKKRAMDKETPKERGTSSGTAALSGISRSEKVTRKRPVDDSNREYRSIGVETSPSPAKRTRATRN